MKQTLTQNTENGVYAVLPRMISLIVALGMSGLILTYPKAMAHVSHGILMLTMLGICAGFIHGVGFVPKTKVWRILFGPWTAWPLLVVGLWILL